MKMFIQDNIKYIECDCGTIWDYTNTLSEHEPLECPSCCKIFLKIEFELD